MFVKGTLAAGILAAVLAFAPEAATAKTKVQIGIGGGSDWCFHHPYSASCRYGHGYYRPPVGYGYYNPPVGYYDPYYLPTPRYRHARISCGEAREIVKDHGYRKVRTRNCGGPASSFVGVKNGGLWLVKVNTRNGRLTRNRL